MGERNYPFLLLLTSLLLALPFFFFTFSSSFYPFLFSFTSLPISSDFHVSLSPPFSTPPIPQEEEKEAPPDDLDLNATSNINWKNCRLGSVTVDYIPCLDNSQAIKRLKSKKHMEHRERHCPRRPPRCLVPLPPDYKQRPPSKLVEYKKDQNWVRKSGDYFVFPGGGTQFKDGVNFYIDFIQKTLPAIKCGEHIRVVLDVGCGVASFGGYLLDKDVITMSFAPKDEHEAQIQFALERGIPATLSVIGTRKLTFPDDAYDLIHCARCRVHWEADGGRPLLELNRVLRPGGFFIWSATPVYQNDDKDPMEALTKSICWKVVSMEKRVGSTRVGLVTYQKPSSSSCYDLRPNIARRPPLCDQKNKEKVQWNERLSYCISRLPVDSKGNLISWPAPWPQRLTSKPQNLPSEPDTEDIFNEDTKHWPSLVSDVYFDALAIKWASVRNVMDMNAGYGGFAAALNEFPLWVMNVVPIDAQDTMPIIFERGLIGIYHDWCESFNTYPRTYDLLHSSFLFQNRTLRCDIVEIAVEMDRILRPDGYLLLQDSMETIKKVNPVLRSLHWSTNLYQGQFLVGKKGSWRPSE
ncbi:putative methyltransferase PMT22 [Hibiscus syriacus]|uniref:Methyltransferase n=1 Tax=Hibiscus syriacus TaxID=106335 RepID=A0A6A3C365_HIBSY|nr:putative methyltransferase PMT22 [Hibiscus syriacus]